MPPQASKSPPPRSRRIVATADLLVERLSRLRRIAFDVSLEAIDDLELGDFAGSAWRGGWFAALKDLGCVVEHRECDVCSLLATCAIPALQGESQRVQAERFFARPFRLRLPAGAHSIAAGETSRIGIDLFGAALPYARLALAGIERLANRGLGRHRGRFEVKSVARRGEDEWRGEFERRIAELPKNCLTIAIETPLRLLDRGRPQPEFSFDRLVSNLLRRATGLVESWGQIDCREFVERARSIAIRATHYRRTDCVRFSSRQQRAMNLMGHVGEIEIAGDLEPFLPLLAFGEAVGAGKGTTFGLGSIRLKSVVVTERAL